MCAFLYECVSRVCVCARACVRVCVCLCPYIRVCVREHTGMLLWFARCITEHTVFNMVYLMCFFQGSIAKKPYNPIIGETFHCSWVLPPDNTSTHHTTDSDTNDQTTGNGDNVAEGETEKGDSGDEERGRREEGRLLYYCAEQVSHHPPSKREVSMSV